MSFSYWYSFNSQESSTFAWHPGAYTNLNMTLDQWTFTFLDRCFSLFYYIDGTGISASGEEMREFHSKLSASIFPSIVRMFTKQKISFFCNKRAKYPFWVKYPSIYCQKIRTIFQVSILLPTWCDHLIWGYQVSTRIASVDTAKLIIQCAVLYEPKELVFQEMFNI